MPTQIPVETEPAWIAATIAASMYMLLVSCAPTVPKFDTALIQKADMPQS